MIFEGSFSVDAPIQDVWDFLVDIPRMSVCFPGMQKVEQTDANTYSSVIAVKVGSIAVSFQGSMVKTRVEPLDHLVSKIHLWDATTASVVTGEAASDLAVLAPDRTQVTVRFDITVRGRLNQFSRADLQSVFQRALDEFAICLRRRMERPANHTQWAAPKSNRFQAWLQSLFAGLRARIKDK
jgi:uncharacterized protein